MRAVNYLINVYLVTFLNEVFSFLEFLTPFVIFELAHWTIRLGYGAFIKTSEFELKPTFFAQIYFKPTISRNLENNTSLDSGRSADGQYYSESWEMANNAANTDKLPKQLRCCDMGRVCLFTSETAVCGWLQVSENESLASIAAQFNSTVSELKVVNRLMSTAVFPGQVDSWTWHSCKVTLLSVTRPNCSVIA